MNPRNIRFDVIQEPDMFKLKEAVNKGLEHAIYQVTSVNFLDKDDNGYTAIIAFDISIDHNGVKVKK